MSNSNNVEIIIGQDVGNGYMKGTAMIGDNTFDIDFQSSASMTLDPVTFGIDPDNTADVQAAIDDIFNCLDVSFNTPLVSNRYRYVLGRQGITQYPENIRQFNVTTMREGKAKDELSSILLLGTIAGIILKDYYAKNKSLPTEDINAKVRIVLALPIDEYIDEREAYPEKLYGCTRNTVEIHNFNVPEHTINVNILFEDVVVLAEGSAAQVAIVTSGRDFIKNLLDQAITVNPEWKEITADDIIASDSSVGIDIGEGTVNYAVFSEGSFSPSLSYTFSKGYGSVLDNAIAAIKREKGTNRHVYKSRKELNNFLAKEVTGTKRIQRNVADQHIEEQRKIFAGEITENLSSVLSRMGSVDVVYVYGGGANAMKGNLYEKLVPIVAKCNPLAPILYMEKGYCRTLNRDGLFACAVARSQSAAKQADKPKK